MKLLKTLAVLSVAVVPMTAGLTLAPDVAYAERGGKSAENRSERAGGREREREQRGNGHRRENPSELKSLNAMYANANAFLSASPDSNIGKIEAYRQAVLTSRTASAEYQDSFDALLKLGVPVKPDSTKEQITALQADYLEGSPEYIAIETFLTEYTEYAGQLGSEDAALTALIGDRELSEAALAEFRAALGLD